MTRLVLAVGKAHHTQRTDAGHHPCQRATRGRKAMSAMTNTLRAHGGEFRPEVPLQTGKPSLGLVIADKLSSAAAGSDAYVCSGPWRMPAALAECARHVRRARRHALSQMLQGGLHSCGVRSSGSTPWALTGSSAWRTYPVVVVSAQPRLVILRDSTSPFWSADGQDEVLQVDPMNCRRCDQRSK